MKRLTTLLLGLSASSLAVAQPPENEIIQLRIQDDDAPIEPAAEAAPVIDAELDEAARITFQRARTAFDAGDYEEALSRFRQAYELSPRPMLLYNIAATLDRLRRDVEAAEALRAFLVAQPDSPERVEIEARIRVLDGIIAERTAREQAAADAAQAEAQRRSDEEARAAEEARRNAEPPPAQGLHPAIAIGVGGAAVVAGVLIIWSGLNAKSRNTDFENYANSVTTPSPEARAIGQALFDETRSAERRTNALIGVAAALGVAAGVLFVFTDFGGGDDDEDGVALRGGATHQGGSLILEGTF